MRYQLKDIDLTLWAWVKAQATLRQMTISHYIEMVLSMTKSNQVEKEKTRLLEEHRLETCKARKHVRDYRASKEA